MGSGLTTWADPLETTDLDAVDPGSRRPNASPECAQQTLPVQVALGRIIVTMTVVEITRTASRATQLVKKDPR